MRHAILGAGGVGLALGAALARGGHDVTLVMRESTRARYSGVIDVHSRLRGDHSVAVRAVGRLDEPVDVLWVTVKAPALGAALSRTGPGPLPGAVVPLLNGLDHPALLRERFGSRQIVGAIRVEAERTGPGRVTWNSLFAEVSLAATEGTPAGSGAATPGSAAPCADGPCADRPCADRPYADGPHATPSGVGAPHVGAPHVGAPHTGASRATAFAGVTASLADAGIACTTEPDPARVLWRKLVLLLPLALATTAADGPLGAVRRQPGLKALLHGAAREACAVAAAEDVAVDGPGLLHTLDTLPGRTDTSLHRDVATGVRPTELAALTEPVLRRARDHDLSLPAITELARRAAERERRAEAPAPHRSTYSKGETS
ncbi:ketopantoate reductase family protein [Streptomyces dangxiongensis]|uniref:ketopantoate reductase family protein n=1 Tax=Streptomyces dangxiongensis TaxID=1442032 RepID=UPI0013CF1D06|nr:2-dehydropantoate 2-reductase N-terminal domain-containing protein [Streptomyces dangxiongensis]